MQPRHKQQPSAPAGAADAPIGCFAPGAAMFSEEAWAAIARRLRLSRRELQIVQGAFDDETERAIAGGLGISPHTVHTHAERLHRKLAVADRAQLLLRVMREFLTLTATPRSGLPPICPNRLANRCPALA